MTSQEAAARFWAGASVFGPDGERAAGVESLSFALVPAGVGAGPEHSTVAGLVSPRPLLGLEGLPAVRTPLLLDATRIQGSPKDWAAIGRGAASAGCALLVRPAQARERKDLLKASSAPFAVALLPDEPAFPDSFGGAVLVVVGLESLSGAPAVLDESALPALLEAARAAAGYRCPASLLLSPGRVPSSGALRAAAEGGAKAVLLAEGRGSARLPLSALAGSSASVTAASGDLAVGLATDAVADGVALAVALACAPAGLATSLPLRLTVKAGEAAGADWKAVGDQLSHALRTLWEDAQRAAAFAGERDPRDLSRENLRALTYDAAALSGVKLAGFDERLPWWAH
jgi:hypothetical protein